MRNRGTKAPGPEAAKGHRRGCIPAGPGLGGGAIAFVLALALTALAPTAAVAQQRGQVTQEVQWWDRAAEGNAGHYWIKTDLPRDEARELAEHLNLIYEAFHRRLGSLPQREPDQLNVLIFQSREDYLYTLQSRFGINAIGTGGVFFRSPRGTAMAIWTESRSRKSVLSVLQHEAFHQFAWSRFGSNFPSWLNEGLATFFGEAVLVGRELVIGQTNERVIDAVREAVREERHVPFRRLLSMSRSVWNDAVREGDARLQYQQSWSMVQFLIYGEGGRYVQAFDQYLFLLSEGVLSEEAFMRAFQTSNVDAFEERWREYAIAARPSAFVTALERIEFLAEGAMELSRRGLQPKSLDELRDELRKIDFTHRFSLHGVVTELRADDDSMFDIPRDDLAREQPVFTIEPSRLGRLTRRQRMLEEEQPTPPSIAVKHLQPHGLGVRWIRDRRDDSLRYEIIVR